MKRIIIFLTFTINLSFAQQIIQVASFGKFSFANSFDIDLNKNFYVSDIIENTISKLDSNGSEIIKIGGLGWGDTSFDEPIDLFTNTLTVYVADKNNNRIIRFDKDLNYISEFSGKDEKKGITFGYPKCIKISDIGDLFILDSDNKRILKFNLNGNFINEIGGNDAGIYAVTNPYYFALDKLSNLYILDDNKITTFDQYGNNLFKFNTEINPSKIEICDDNLIFITESSITIFNLIDRKVISEFSEFTDIDHNEKITGGKLVRDLLFVLTSKRIIKYKIIR